jgi:hypothetical protein
MMSCKAAACLPNGGLILTNWQKEPMNQKKRNRTHGLNGKRTGRIAGHCKNWDFLAHHLSPPSRSETEPGSDYWGNRHAAGPQCGTLQRG